MTRAQIHERHIERLEQELEGAQKALVNAHAWPLCTPYYSMVKERFPAKIQKLGDRINTAYGKEVWTRT